MSSVFCVLAGNGHYVNRFDSRVYTGMGGNEGVVHLYRYGAIGLVQVQQIYVEQSVNKTLFTLPEGFRHAVGTPKPFFMGYGYAQGTSSDGQVVVGDGAVSVWSDVTSAYFSGQCIYMLAPDQEWHAE